MHAALSVKFREPKEIIAENPTWLFNEIHFCVLGLLTLLHALRNGRYHFFWWLTIVIHGLNTELIAYWVPDVNNFWHSQSTTVLFDGRAPLHVVFFVYLIFDYTSTIAFRRLKLPLLAEACAVGLGAVVMDLPYDIMGVKLLWWTWHDTDPNIGDRMYNVPWTSYYFHATFACSLTLLFHGFRRMFLGPNNHKKRNNSLILEFLAAFFAGMLGFLCGAAQFIPIYHVFHDLYHIHSEVCVLILFSIYFLIILRAYLNQPSETAEPEAEQKQPSTLEILLLVAVHYIGYMALVILAEPEKYTSTGLHEPIGTSCAESVPLQTLSGLVLRKKKYFCPSAYDEPYFDFNCTKAGKALPSAVKAAERERHWYTICGTAYPNRAEYTTVIWAVSCFGLLFFSTLLTASFGRQRLTKNKKQKSQ